MVNSTEILKANILVVDDQNVYVVLLETMHVLNAAPELANQTLARAI